MWRLSITDNSNILYMLLRPLRPVLSVGCKGLYSPSSHIYVHHGMVLIQAMVCQMHLFAVREFWMKTKNIFCGYVILQSKYTILKDVKYTISWRVWSTLYQMGIYKKGSVVNIVRTRGYRVLKACSWELGLIISCHPLLNVCDLALGFWTKETKHAS